MASAAIGPVHASTIAVDERSGRAWSVNPDNDTVTAIDVLNLVRLFEAPVGDNPRTLAPSPDGSVWVVNQDDATITVLDGRTGDVRESLELPYASRPYGLAFCPQGEAAYITLQAVGRLLKLNARTGAVEDAVDVGPTPRGIAVSADGGRILVTRYVSPSDRAEVTEVSVRPFRVARRFALAADPGPDSPVGSRGVPNNLASVTIAPDGQRAWIPSKKDNTGRGLHLSGEPLTFETTTRTIVSVLDLAANREILGARRDLDNRAMAVAVAFDPAGEFAFVALQGSNSVDVLDAGTGNLATSIPGTGLAPQGLAVDARGRLFVQNFLSRDVAVYDLSGLEAGAAIPLLARIATTGREPLPPQVLLGKQVFYNAADPRMSRDGYVSCAGCHIEGGSDGRVWDYSGRGAHGGGLRNTKSLYGRSGLGHGPLHWRADMDEIQDFEILLRQTLEGRGFVSDAVFHGKGADWVFGTPNAGLSPELDALAAYVTSFEKVHPSPYRLPSGLMTADALAGEAIFHSPETGCATCHVSPRFTDSSLRPALADAGDAAAKRVFPIVMPGLPFRLHDVGTLTEAAGDFRANTLRALDTPTVKGVWETPPYLHDGSAATLMDVITTRNAGDRHGRTSQLAATGKAQLVAYLQQLDDTRLDTSATVSQGLAESEPPGADRAGQANPLHFKVRAGLDGGILITGFRLNANDVRGIDAPRRIKVHLDSNGNSRLDAGDTLLAEAVTVPGGGMAPLTLDPPQVVRAGATVSLVAVSSTARDAGATGTPSAPVDDACSVELIDVDAVGLTSGRPSVIAGLPVRPEAAGRLPRAGPFR
ncbi:MAG: hypothetical protein OXP09_15855 [Gammaproteobacteria bacterium]|nr:hypothetical protein [Gammaproteobacteria bacterium]